MKWKSILAIGLAAFLPNTMVSAEILEVDAVGEYTAGKNETMLVAEEFARQEAHRIAIEQVGIYLESHTEMIDQQITKDEVRAVAAAILKVPEENYDQEFVGNGGFKVTCRIHAVIDTEKVDIATIASDKKDLKNRNGLMNKVDQLEEENRILKERLETSGHDTELQKQFIENQRQFLVKSYEELLYSTPPEHMDIDVIKKLSDLDPQGYSSNYFLYHYYLSHDDDQKSLESAKQGVRKIRKIYSPEQIKKFTTLKVEDNILEDVFDYPESCVFDLYSACFGVKILQDVPIGDYILEGGYTIGTAYSEEEV